MLTASGISLCSRIAPALPNSCSNTPHNINSMFRMLRVCHLAARIRQLQRPSMQPHCCADSLAWEARAASSRRQVYSKVPKHHAAAVHVDSILRYDVPCLAMSLHCSPTSKVASLTHINRMQHATDQLEVVSEEDLRSRIAAITCCHNQQFQQ